MTSTPEANVNFAVYTHREDEAMKFNTNEFSGDALREAVDQFGSDSTHATPDPVQPAAGRHAAGGDEHQDQSPRPEESDVDTPAERINGAPAEGPQPAGTEPAQPAAASGPADEDDAAQPPEEHRGPALAPPPPVEVEATEGLLNSSHTTSDVNPKALDVTASGYRAASQHFDDPSHPNTPSSTPPYADAPLLPQPGQYRPHPQQQRRPEPPPWTPPATSHTPRSNWPPAEPTDFGTAMPTPPPWAEEPPQHPAAAPDISAYHQPQPPELGARGPVRPHQDWPTQQIPPWTPQQDPRMSPRTPHDWAPPPRRQEWPAQQPPQPPHWDTPHLDASQQPAQDPAAAPQRPQHRTGSDPAAQQQSPSRAPLPTPPPPPNLGSEKADHAFALQSQRKEGPTQGWRAALNRVHIPIRKSAAEQAYDKDIATINRTFRYSKTIGIAAFKGGVGKTTCALCLASTVAEHRTKGEVAALDTDDRGSLARRVRGEQESDIKRFAADPDLQTPNEVKSHMMSNSHRLSVLGSSQSPLADGLQPDEYLRAQRILQNNHLFVFVDMDTSAASPAYETIMHSLDALVLVTSTSLDSAEAGRSMREWLRARGLHELAAHTLVLMNHQSPAKPFLDLESTANYYRNTEECPVLEIPWDEHLAEASVVSLDLLNKNTRRQFVKAASTLVGMLPSI